MKAEETDAPVAKNGYIQGLDGIRAIAIGLVLFSHSIIFGDYTQMHAIGLSAGYSGVAIFFVLSGYLITTLLLREEEITGGINLSLFYMRRALRLFPALWIYLAVVFVLWISGGLDHHPGHSFVTSLLYVRNIVGRGHETDHLWSLSLEEQFYLFWPLLFLTLPRRHVLRLVIAITVILAVTVWRSSASIYGLASSGALYIRSDFRCDAPLFGCALALAERVSPRMVSLLNASSARSNALTIAILAGLSVWVVFGVTWNVLPGLDSTIVSILAILLILSQVGVEGSLSRVMAWRPMVLLGQISYGVYLWQQLFLGPSTGVMATMRRFPLGLVLTLTIAAASFRFVERPLIKLKNKRFRKSDVRVLHAEA